MRTLSENFVPYPEAKDIKDLGFNEEQTTCFGNFINEKLCLGFFHSTHCTKDTILAPTYGQAFDFFREKYNLIPNVESIYTDETRTEIKFWFWIGNHKEYSDDEVFYDTYEEAELECLVKLIEIVKNK